MSSVSPLGSDLKEIWANYMSSDHKLSEITYNEQLTWVGKINDSNLKEIETIKQSEALFNKLDPTVLMAVMVSRKAFTESGWSNSSVIGVNFGSSRGATSLFEKYHKTFIDQKNTPTLTSPTTTLGNISSWVAHDLMLKGPDISHSITCSTALHALLNGVAWIQSGMTKKFIVGGSEAPLTDFTVAQMKALKIYASKENKYPCQALNSDKKSNSMVLGEGAAAVCLEEGVNPKRLAQIIGIGYATEILEHNVSLSTEGNCFKTSMLNAMKNIDINDVDVIVTHTPGTIKGDQSELNAIKSIFNTNIPALTCNKWKIGHSLGTSGMLSLEMAILMLQNQQFIATPFATHEPPKKIEKLLVNAVGFGGNAVSILLSK